MVLSKGFHQLVLPAYENEKARKEGKTILGHWGEETVLSVEG